LVPLALFDVLRVGGDFGHRARGWEP